MGEKNNNYGLDPWKRGDELTAKHLDQPRQVLAKQNGITPGSQVVDPLVPQMRCQQMSVLEVKKDYLICYISDGVGLTDGEGILDEMTVPVALPHLLQQTHYEEKEAERDRTGDDGELRKELTYEYNEDNVRRIATNTDDETEDQIIIPSYEKGDIIFAFTGMSGGTNVETELDDVGDTYPVMWMDLNVDGRFWAKDNDPPAEGE